MLEVRNEEEEERSTDFISDPRERTRAPFLGWQQGNLAWPGDHSNRWTASSPLRLDVMSGLSWIGLSWIGLGWPNGRD